MRVSEAERLSEDALFLGEKAMYQDLCYACVIMHVSFYYFAQWNSSL